VPAAADYQPIVHMTIMPLKAINSVSHVAMVTRLVYVHDPMCSWCWAFRPALETLCQDLPPGLAFKRLLGGLAPDADTPMPKDMQRYLQQTWRRILQQVPDTKFNFDFWSRCKPRRSTYPSCRAVIAARHQEPAAEDAMILAIQRAYYTQARNPSLKATLIELSAEIGLDTNRFSAGLDAPETHQALLEEVATARSLGANSFPGLVLLRGQSRWQIPVDYRDPGNMLTALCELLS
jgi:putative protein-disulfide isomerase